MIKKLENIEPLYDFFVQQINAPYYFPVSFSDWKQSMFNDIDGNGNKLFCLLDTYVSYYYDKITGFIQYGMSNIGFDESGEITNKISYPIIRNFFFLEDFESDGIKLLEKAMNFFNLKEEKTIYAFFHYFGMSCYGRHGKLFGDYSYIEKILAEKSFKKEHENIYYSRNLTENNINKSDSKIALKLGEISIGKHQYIAFIYDSKEIGGCEIQYLPQGDIAYLRWIYIDSSMTHKGFGTLCMQRLSEELYYNGIRRFDTDTADSNFIAQNYYSKLGFLNEGITRSYYTK